MGFEQLDLESAVSGVLDAVYEMVDSRRRWGFGVSVPGVDRVLVELAAAPDSFLADIERVVRAYGLYASQGKLPSGPALAKGGVRICRGENGWGRIPTTLSDLEVDEFASALQAFVDLRNRPGRPVDESPGGDFVDGSGCGDPADESPRRDRQPPVGVSA